MIIFRVLLLLAVANTVMCFAWYSHLKIFSQNTPLIYVILWSWGLALLEYSALIPACRLAERVLTLQQLRMLQEGISLTVFVPFVLFYMRRPLTWNYLWACLCILGAIYFIFRGNMDAAPTISS